MTLDALGRAGAWESVVEPRLPRLMTSGRAPLPSPCRFAASLSRARPFPSSAGEGGAKRRMGCGPHPQPSVESHDRRREA